LIIYLDTSALVKVYIQETGSKEVTILLSSSPLTGTSHLSKAEMSAALAMAVRVNYFTLGLATEAWQKFLSDWQTLFKLSVSEIIIDKAASLAWGHGLRGYDAVHLATALVWQEAIGETVTLATFDRQLKGAGERAGLSVWPVN